MYTSGIIVWRYRMYRDVLDDVTSVLWRIRCIYLINVVFHTIMDLFQDK